MGWHGYFTNKLKEAVANERHHEAICPIPKPTVGGYQNIFETASTPISDKEDKLSVLPVADMQCANERGVC